MAPKFFSGGGEEDEEEKQAKKNKEKDGEVEVDIKFRVNKRALERACYITLIVILLAVIVFLLFSKKDCSEQKTEKVVEDLTEETPKSPIANKTTTTTTTIKPNVTGTPKKNETKQENKTITAKTTVNAELIFTKDDIKTEGVYPTTKITSVKYKVNNIGAKFIAKVKLKSYDQSDEDDIQNIVRAKDEFVVEEGATITRTMETFSPKLLRATDVSEIFVLTLYDAKDDKEISSKLVNYSP